MKDSNGFPRRPVMNEPDQAVTAILRDGTARVASRGKSKRAARQARIDATRTTMRIDVPPDLKIHLEKIAHDLGCPASQLVNRVIWEGLERLDLETLRGELIPCRSMRYPSALPYPGESQKVKS